MKTQEPIISKEVAFKDVTEFVNRHVFEEVTEEDVKENYNVLVLAYSMGLLDLAEDKPVFKLKEPVKSEEGAVVLEEVTFKTRIRPNELANLSKGLNLSKQSFEYALKCTAHIISQPTAMLNKLGKFDYTVIQQLSAVFM